MDETIRPIDLTAARPLLDALAVTALAAVPGEALRMQAEAVLERLQAAPRTAPDAAGRPAAPEESGWQALHCPGGPGEITVLCWREAPPPGISLQGTWNGGRLENVILTAGERTWGAQATPWGDLAVEDPEGVVEGPALERMAADSGRRAKEHREALAAALATLGGWDCPACGWFNETAAVLCGGCRQPVPTPPAFSSPPEIAAAAAGGGGLDWLAGSLLAAIRKASPQAAGGAGASLPPAPDLCTDCGTAWEADDRFCSGCGAPRPRTCPACHSPLPPSAAFCTACGASLPPAPATGGRP